MHYLCFPTYILTRKAIIISPKREKKESEKRLDSAQIGSPINNKLIFADLSNKSVAQLRYWSIASDI